jgi:hypothetical protein
MLLDAYGILYIIVEARKRKERGKVQQRREGQRMKMR